MKKVWICLAVLVVVLGIIAIVLYPPHPRSWSTLRKGMTRSEVLATLDLSDLELIDRNLNPPSSYETWAKNYWDGRWTLKCIYYLDGRYLLFVTVKYESSVFPWLSRMRHYN